MKKVKKFMSMEDIAAPTIACPELLMEGNLLPRSDYRQLSHMVAGLEDENRKLRRVNEALGAWLSAELCNEHASPETKDIVKQWFAEQNAAQGL